MEDCWQQVTHRIFHDSQPLKMNLTNPQRQLDKWPLSVQMKQPWRGLEYARMEDCLQQRTRWIFHDNCSGKTRRVSPQGLLSNWSFDVQVDHPWRQIEWPRMEDHWHQEPITYSMTPSLESRSLRAATGHWTRGPWWYRWNTNGCAVGVFGRTTAADSWTIQQFSSPIIGLLCGRTPDPQETGIDVREKGYFAAWNSTATPKKCCFHHLYELLSLGKFTAMLSRD
ncbi:uncharacterized protein LOC120875281 [Oryx dammah]|uniref:uncharacterized protein LOC120875281 n=1 Tax=Oryx dammah TaxID=59534 RepID=UPI001A9AF872|nr:uncharacterized protein LOC120875281 [Oryx dammah]XP_040112993.1 uncharacterized protein LOC120875281 [Oryx dammah]